MDFNTILSGLFEKLSGFSKERPHAGQKYRLMGIMAEYVEVIRQLRTEVLTRVSQEAPIDVDIDIDYSEMAERALQVELPVNLEGWQSDKSLPEVLAETEVVGRMDADDAKAFTGLFAAVDSLSLPQLVQMANETLGELNSVLLQIDAQLKRRHTKEEYVRLYEAEKRRYMSSGTPGRAIRAFDEWMELCDGAPTLENIYDYRLEKVLHLFKKNGVKADHVYRATHYKDEIDFEQMEDEAQRKWAYRHYAALRQITDWRDGCLVPIPHKIGQMFFLERHEENAKARRGTLLRYLHKIQMVQQEMRRLLEAERGGEGADGQLNYFAPEKNLKVLLSEEWFEIHRTDKGYDHRWTNDFVNALMASEHRDYIATEWGKNKRQDYIRGCVLGLLKEGGIIKGSMDSIARSAGVCENYRTFSKYMGQCRQEQFAQWVQDYITKKK